MAKSASLGLAALLAWTLAAQVALADEHSRWQKLENKPDCVVWNEYPVEQETVTWSGACANGKTQGDGTLVWRYVEDGEWKESRYEGEMKDSKADGRGKFTNEYGVYEGDFKDDKYNGRGVWVGANGNRYEGDFKDNKFHGRGVAVLASGNRYEGDFRGNLRHGHGVYVWGPNSEWPGDRYEGDYRNDKRHGRGTFYFANGHECEGDWREGTLVGKGRGRAEGRQMKCYAAGGTIRFAD